jgi:hypothetical protein
MAPKRRRDVAVKEIPKTYTFGRSLIDEGDVASLQKNRMIGTARAPGRETVPKPQENEVFIFQDLLFAGLRFPLHPATVDILQYFDIYLHQLTPNAILRLSVYMWICRTTKIKPSTEGFALAHQVHHQRHTIFEEEGDDTVEKDCQFGCLNFSYKSGVVGPVTAYHNKWPSDWQQHRLYHTVTPLVLGELHPLAMRDLPPLHDSYTKNPACPEGDDFIMMLAGSLVSIAPVTSWRSTVAFQYARCWMGGQWLTTPGQLRLAASLSLIGRRFLASPRPMIFRALR